MTRGGAREGAGRPSLGDAGKKALGTRLSVAAIEGLALLAKVGGKPKAQVLEGLIADALAKLDPDGGSYAAHHTKGPDD